MITASRRKMSYPPREKVLLVEGATEVRLIPFLMEANGVAWPDDKANASVQIRDKDGFQNIVDRAVIEAEIRETSRRITGIILDADQTFAERWINIRNCCLPYFPELPDETIPDGLIVSNSDNQRLGIWIMPDNQSHGMLEAFLLQLVPGGEADPLLIYARQSCQHAKANLHAPYKDTHIRKAEIHTWLAWQDEPGRQLHQAVSEMILNPKSPTAEPFVRWFRELFEV